VKTKLLFEEVMQYNKWVSGIASRELGTQQVTLKDLFDKTVDQFPNDAQADKVLPYPINGVIQQLGDLYINACNSRMLFKGALKNPIVQENKLAKQQVLNIIEKLTKIINELKSIFKDTTVPVDKKVEKK
jgi:hypothetical protein